MQLFNSALIKSKIFITLILSLPLFAVSGVSQAAMDATITLNGSNQIQIVLNSDITFEFNQTVTGAAGYSVIIDEVYATDPGAVTTSITSGAMNFTATNGNSGSAIQMGPFGFDFGQYTIRDEEITFPAPASSYSSGDRFTLQAGTILSLGNHAAPIGINPGPYTAFIVSDDYLTIAAPEYVDTTPPVVSSIPLVGAPAANAASVTFTVNFDENANAITTDDFTVTTVTGDASGTVSSISASSGSSVTATVNTITGTGSFRLDLDASTNIVDDSGNGNGTNGSVATFTSGGAHTVDRDPPVVTENTAVSTPTSDTTPDVTIDVGEAGTLAIGGSCGSAQEGAISAGTNQTITLTQTDNSTPLTDTTYSDCTVTVTDAAGNANSATALTSFTVATNSAPTVSTMPTDVTVTEDIASNLNISASAFADTDGDPLTVTLTASAGTMAATSGGSVTVGGSGTGTLTLAGTVANINTFLDTASNVLYTSAFNDFGDDAQTLSVNANDGTVNPLLATVNLDITGQNDAPTVAGMPTDITVLEDIAGNLNLSSSSFADVDGDSLTVTLTASEGTMAATSGGSVTVGGSGTGTLTLAGTVANINTFLDTASNVLYTGAFNDNGNDTATVQVRANDTTVNPLLATVNMDITAQNDAPTDISSTLSSINQSATAVGADVGTLDATDVDDSSFTFTKVSNGTAANGACGVGNDADNASFQINATTLETSGALSAGSYDICLQADDGGTTYEKTFAITVVDNVGPVVSSVAVPANATYVSGTNLDFTVNFNEDVTDIGADSSLTITLDTGGAVVANVQSSTASSITYRYTVAVGNEDVNGVSVTSLSVGSGIQDGAANAANSTLNSVGSTAAVLVDAIVPTISSVAVPANATYIVGGNLDFTVNFAENITDVGADSTLSITLDTGGAVNANVQSSTANSITYRYTVVAGNEDTNGITVNSIGVGSGIQDGAGNALNTTLNGVGSTTAVLVDGIVPTISSVSVPANATYVAGNNLDFTVSFAENITDVGADSTLSITLDTGGAVNATVQSSTANSITYRYTVAAGNEDTNGIVVTSLNVGSGIQDGSGNAVNATLNSVGSTVAVLVDAIAPTIASVAVPANATYAVGDNLDFTVNFAENVTDTSNDSSLTITLDTGGAVVAARQSSTANSITYRYTVVLGNEDTNGIAVTSLSVGSGVTDSVGNALNTTLNSVGITAAVLVDGIAPRISDIFRQTPATSPTNSDTLVFGVAFNEDPLNVSVADFTVSGTTATVTNVNQIGSANFDITVSGGDLATLNGTVTLGIAGGQNITDLAGNALTNTTPTVQNINTFVVDNLGPTATISAPATTVGPFDITVTFGASVTGFTSGEITATNGTVSAFAGSGTTYTATVTPVVVGVDTVISVAGGVAIDVLTNGNIAAADAVVSNNTPGIVNISGTAADGQTLTASVSDVDGATGAITYQWMSNAANVGSNSASYAVQTSDVGNSLSVNATYTDDLGSVEDITSSSTAPALDLAGGALVVITEGVGGFDEEGLPTVEDYENAGIEGVTEEILDLLNNAVINQTYSLDNDDPTEVQAVVDEVLEGQDNDGDGIPNLVEGTGDTDGDGILDRDDIDSDNDGISDQAELGLDQTDSDNDGIIDVLDADVGNDGVVDLGKTDYNFDGVDDDRNTLFKLQAGFDTVNSDNDSILNHLDIDSDNDGILDLTEAGFADVDGDGLLDIGDTVITDATQLDDTDDDGTPNTQESISDGITTDRIVAGFIELLDFNGDGVIDNTIDMDNDGLIDIVDGAVGAHGTIPDADGDGIANHADNDADNDGFTNGQENPQLAFFTGLDVDGDGIDDGVDAEVNGEEFGTDVDENGVQDDHELTDSDGDGIADYLDDDSDNNGINDGVDAEEAAATEAAAEAAAANDIDGDGVDNQLDSDIDGDGFDNGFEEACESDPLESESTPLNDGSEECQNLSAEEINEIQSSSPRKKRGIAGSLGFSLFGLLLAGAFRRRKLKILSR